MVGLKWQQIDRPGIEGAWYCLLTDGELGVHINVRLTAPQGDGFPDRRLITAVFRLSAGQTFATEVKTPYSVAIAGCPVAVPPCL